MGYSDDKPKKTGLNDGLEDVGGADKKEGVTGWKGLLKEGEQLIVEGEKDVREKELKARTGDALYHNSGDILGRKSFIPRRFHHAYEFPTNSPKEALTLVNRMSNPDESYKIFVKANGLSDQVEKKMMKNAKLKEVFIELVDFRVEDEGSRVEFKRKAKIYKDLCSKYSPIKCNESLKMARGDRQFLEITGRLLRGKDSEEFHERGKDLNERRKQGMEDEQYYAELEEIYSQFVEKSDDEELKEMWKAAASEDEVSKLVDEESGGGDSPSGKEVPIQSKAEADSALSDVSGAFAGTGFRAEFSENGAATVHVENFSLNLSVYKDVETDKFTYYIEDPYVHGEKAGPFFAENLPEAVDDRQIDAYITSRVGELSHVANDLESVSDLMDNAIVLLGKSLIGAGDSRFFVIKGENREVLDSLVSVLVSDDSKYVTLYDKVVALNRFMGKDENVSSVRRQLLSGGKVSVGELVA